MAKREVGKEMEAARTLANGTMQVWVIFDTDEQVQEAKAWMKGRQKVKNLEPITAQEASARKNRRRREIEKALSAVK